MITATTYSVDDGFTELVACVGIETSFKEEPHCVYIRGANGFG
jgi:hypothetical protein